MMTVEAAELLGRSRVQVNSMCYHGVLTGARKLGFYIVVPTKSVLAEVERRDKNPGDIGISTRPRIEIPPLEGWLRIAEAATTLGLARQSVNWLLRQKVLRPRRIGHVLVVSEAEVAGEIKRRAGAA